MRWPVSRWIHEQLAELRCQLGAMRRSMSDVETQMAQLTGQVTDLRAAEAELKQAVADAGTRVDARLVKLQASVDDLTAKLAAAGVTISLPDLSGDVAEIRAEVARLAAVAAPAEPAAP